jgi:uncharacterized protein (DUF433 family)
MAVEGRTGKHGGRPFITRARVAEIAREWGERKSIRKS